MGGGGCFTLATSVFGIGAGGKQQPSADAFPAEKRLPRRLTLMSARTIISSQGRGESGTANKKRNHGQNVEGGVDGPEVKGRAVGGGGGSLRLSSSGSPGWAGPPAQAAEPRRRGRCCSAPRGWRQMETDSSSSGGGQDETGKDTTASTWRFGAEGTNSKDKRDVSEEQKRKIGQIQQGGTDLQGPHLLLKGLESWGFPGKEETRDTIRGGLSTRVDRKRHGEHSHL